MFTSEFCQEAAYSQGFCPVAPGRLPVFMCKTDNYAIFYAPRFVCVLPSNIADSTERLIRQLVTPDQAGNMARSLIDTPYSRLASRIVHAARSAEDESVKQSHAPFSPECLTLFLNNACNLNCRYCHASPNAEPDRPITDDAIKSAAKLVASSCAQKGCSFTVAFHGGGEPTLDEALVDRILSLTQEAAQRCGVSLRTYIATNGVISENKARWLAGRFDLVGLSCDGPPDIQEYQRPARDGLPTSERIGRTANILRQADKPFHLRATITKETIGRQAEIAAYFIEQYSPTEIRLEPVYVNPAGTAELSMDDAFLFVAGFMDARRVAADKRVHVTTSMTRPASIYGRHCNMLRQVLNLVPGDIATGCFLDSRASDIIRRKVKVGCMNLASKCLDLDLRHMEFLASPCSEIPSGCRECLCCYQCTHGCPDLCALHASVKSSRQGILAAGFRCRAHRLLLEALIRESADRAWNRTPIGVNQDVVFPDTMLQVAVQRGTSI